MTEAVNQCGGGCNDTHIHTHSTHTYTHRGQWPRGFRSTHLLPASVSHLNKLSRSKLYKEITACALVNVPFFLKAISSPVTATPYPFSSPALYISLFSPSVLGRCQADLTPLSWAFWHQLAYREVRRMGCYWRRRAKKRFDLNQMAYHIHFVLSPTHLMTAQSTITDFRLGVKPLLHIVIVGWKMAHRCIIFSSTSWECSTNFWPCEILSDRFSELVKRRLFGAAKLSHSYITLKVHYAKLKKRGQFKWWR